jgi:dUTP pyrophosphatase
VRATKFLRLHPEAVKPEYAYPGDAGMDLTVVGDHSLNPGEARDLPTGIAAEPPPGYYLHITARSSTLRKLGLEVKDGEIDAGYRGELMTYVTNKNAVRVRIEHHARLAQAIVTPLVQTQTIWVDELSAAARGMSGFGSTGQTGVVAIGATLEERANTPPLLYLGGPVDYASFSLGGEREHHAWRHDTALWAGFSVYCPICQNQNTEDWREVIDRNERALARARFAVFDLRGDFSVGTPIEAWTKSRDSRLLPEPRAVILVHPRPPGVFVKAMVERGAMVASDFSRAADLLGLVTETWEVQRAS